MQTLILRRSDVAQIADMPLSMAAVEQAFRAFARGEAWMPAKVYLDLPAYDGDMRAMPALMGAYAGVKWVNSHARNPERFGLPSVLGTYVLSDPKSGYPLAVMDASLLTALRTGAAAGVATKALARPGFDRVGFVGSGVQARFFRDALATLGSFEVWASDADPARAQAFADESGGRAVSIADACSCPVICTGTPVRSPIVRRAWVAAGTHINAMGADGPGKQELSPELLKAGRIIIDEMHQAAHGGELNVPLRDGLISEQDVAATLGEVLCGLEPGRRSADDITIFDSTGLAIQDVALAGALYERALERGVGLRLDLVGA